MGIRASTLFTVGIIGILLLCVHLASSTNVHSLISSLSSNPKVTGLENLGIITKAIDSNYRKASGVPVILKLKHEIDEDMLKRKEILIKRRIPRLNVLIVETPLEMLEYLASLPEVETVHIPKQIFLNLQDSVPLIRADKVWNLQVRGMNLTGRGITVCIIDSGIDYTHTDLGNCTTAYQPANDTVRVVQYILNITPTTIPLIQNYTIRVDNFSSYSIHIKKFYLGADSYLYIYDNNGTLVQEYNWDYGKDVWTPPVLGKNVTIGVLINDTYSYIYIDMVANGSMIPNISVCPRIVGGYDFVNDDPLPQDDVGHGTAVAGVIGANGTLKGVAPDVNFVIIKACFPFLWTGVCSEDAILSGIYYCVENARKYNISVISMSLGAEAFSTYCDDYDEVMTQAIKYALSNNVTVVVASGNDGYSTEISWPACINGTIPVGATTKQDTIAYFSSRSPNFEYFIFAPGENILTTVPQYVTPYEEQSGTSFATPHVSGVVALMYQLHRLLYSTLPTPRLVMKKLVETGVPIVDPDTNHTYPRVDAYAAVMSMDNTPPQVSFLYPSSDLITNQTNLTINLKLFDNLALKNASAFLLSNGTKIELQRWGFQENTRAKTVNLTVNFTHDGIYIINITACDYSSCTSSLRSVVVDTTPPSIHPNISNGTTFNVSTITIGIECHDLTPITRMEYCMGDLCSPMKCEGGQAQALLGNLTDGPHLLVVEAEDAIGNINVVNLTFSVMERPKLFVNTEENRTILTTNNISLSIRSTDNTELKELTILVNGDIYEHISANASTVEVNSTIWLEDGEHTLAVCATDQANLSTCTYLKLVVDGTSPLLHAALPASIAYLNSTIVPLEFNASDRPFNVLECEVILEKFNGSGWITIDRISLHSNGTPVNYSTNPNLDDGLYNITIKCRDAANHTNMTNSSFIVDTLPPAMVVRWNKGNSVDDTLYINESSLELNLTINDLGAGLQHVQLIKTAENLSETLLNITYHNFTTITTITLPITLERENTTLIIVAEDSTSKAIERIVHLVMDTAPPRITYLSVPARVALNSNIDRVAVCRAEDNETGIYKVEVMGDTTATGSKTLVCCVYDYSLNRVCNETTYYVYSSRARSSITTSSASIVVVANQTEKKKERIVVVGDDILIRMYAGKSRKVIDLSNQSILPFIKKVEVVTSTPGEIEVRVSRTEPGNNTVLAAFRVSTPNISNLKSINMRLTLSELLGTEKGARILIEDREGSRMIETNGTISDEILLRLTPPATISLLKKETTQSAPEELTIGDTVSTAKVGVGEQRTHGYGLVSVALFVAFSLLMFKTLLYILKKKRRKTIISDMERLNLLQVKIEELLKSENISREDRKKLENLKKEVEKLHMYLKNRIK